MAPFALPAQDAGDSATPTVTVVPTDIREVIAEVPITGTLVPREEILVTPQLTGVQIRKVNVDVGDWVNAGDVLVLLRSDLFEAQLSQAEAQLASAESAIRQARNQITSTEASQTQAESELERMVTLMEGGNVSQATYDAALAQAAAARAAAASARDGLTIAEAQRAQAFSQRDIARLNLSWTQIVAPVGGIIGTRNADVGALTAVGQAPLMTIIGGGVIELSAEVIETSLGELEPGQGGSVQVSGADRDLIGLVRIVAPTVDPVTRLGEVRITVEGDAALRSGVFASGSIVTDRHDATTVPVTAVLTDNAGPYVQVVRDGTVERREVVPGLIWRSYREIMTGLAPGETVIARAGAFFRDGDHVRPVEAATGAGP